MEPHERLSEALNTRRLELRKRWKALAADAGLSEEALRAIRRGDFRPTELTARRLDEALGWEPGRVEAILDDTYRGVPLADSGQAEDDADPELRRLLELWPQARQWQRRSIVGILEQMLTKAPAAPPTETPGQERRQSG